MDFVQFFFFNQIFFITLSFCNSYKFNCEYKNFRKKCSLYISITELDYRNKFLYSLPEELRKGVQNLVEAEKPYTTNFLTRANGFLKMYLTRNILKMFGLIFNWKGEVLSKIYLLENKYALRNYKRYNDVNNWGRKLHPYLIKPRRETKLMRSSALIE